MKKYDIILADPPWMERGGGKIKRGADKHYPLMKAKDIAALNIKNITNDNCHLYLWTTNSFLPKALKVVEAWGFEYKTLITWHKDRFGLGQYFRGQTEHCIFAVKGMMPYKVINGKRQQGTTIFNAFRSKHSLKPEKIFELIEKVSDRKGFNKIELFARARREGWDAWGNQVPDEEQRKLK